MREILPAVITSIHEKKDENNFPESFKLYQNYPNPFNPTTTIQYAIPESENVNISIFNSLGEKVKTLVNTFKESGSYKINFDAKEFSSGIYYYRLAAGNYSQTRKMILLK